MNSFMSAVAQICGLLVCFLLGGLGVTLIVLIWTNRIDLQYLVSDENGDASMSRFQLLIFTFVVAIGLFKLVEVKQQFPEIPNGVLTLLGISASTYAVGKGISFSRPAPDDGSGEGADGGHGSGPKGDAARARAAAQEAAVHAATAKQAAAQATGELKADKR